MKASPVGKPVFVKEGKHTFKEQAFAYRGHEYFVRYTGWFAASDAEPWMQHKREQARIDEIIEQESKPEKPHSIEDTADYAFAKLFNYWETGEYDGR